MDEICFVIPGTNEIGAKLTRWIIITDYANLIVIAVVEKMNKWSIDLTYLLPCTLTSMNTFTSMAFLHVLHPDSI